jgi:serine protease Do
MRKRVEQSLGSGFIIDASGLIVTNAHVVKDAQEVVVVLSNGQEYPAKIALVDTPSDLGLLRIDPQGKTLPTARLGSSDNLEVGDIVLAIGNPFGVGQTVTSGIISALARSNTDINAFDFFIQTDAAINPGNSGGPLVAMDGSVIGVNSAIFSKTGGSLGIGFAIPTEMLQAVLKAEQSGQVSKRGIVRPWLGFEAQTMTSDIAQSLGFESPHGALVSDVSENSSGEQAGLKRGDVITALNGRPIKDSQELKFRIATLPIGSTTTLTIRRENTDTTLTFIASAPPEIPARQAVTIKDKNILEGATIINVSPAVIEEMGLMGQDDGVVIHTVNAQSTAARLGLQAGDGLIAIGNHSITDTSKLKKLLSSFDARQGWVLTIRRNGRDQTIILR